MHFTAYAIVTLPDVDTTRRLYRLEDLDDTAVAKVAFHRRKQQTGGECLGWDQQALGALALVEYADGDLRLQRLVAGEATEEEMLRAYYEAATGGPMVCWDGVDHGPILRFRTLVHGLSRPPRWREYDAGEGPWIDLARRLAGPHAERPALDQIARRLGLPGLLGYADVDLVDAWLEGRRAEVDGYCELAALNVLLLALRWFGVTGELAQGATGAAVDRLRDLFWDASEPHRIAFRDALGHA